MSKFCSRCQAETERNKLGLCFPCARARSSAWRKENPGVQKQLSAAWRSKNPEKVKSYRVAYLELNPDKSKAAHAAWRVLNFKRLKASNAAWRASNPERAKANAAAWRAANPENGKINVQNRLAKKRANGGILSQGLSAKLFKLQRGKCACCSSPLGTNFHLDHIMPIALGGPNTDENIQLLRGLCNKQKHAAHPVDFMQQRGFLL